MSNRIVGFAAVLLSAAIIALGWFLGVQPRLADAAAADAERQNVVATNAGLEAQLVQLREEFERIDELRDEVKELRASIPAEADYSGFVAELNALAAASGAPIIRVSVGDASWYSSGIPEAPAEEQSAPPTGSASADGAETPETPDTQTPAAASPIPVPIDSSLINGSNFVAIPVTIELAAGTELDPSMALMGGLQSDKRLFLVTGFTHGGAASPRIDGLLYVLLGTSTPPPAAAG